MFLEKEISIAFYNSFSAVSSEEKFESASFSFTGNNIELPSEELLTNLFSKIASTDKFEMLLKLGETTPILFQSAQNNLPNFINEINIAKSFYIKGENIHLKVSIIKSLAKVNIYSINHFIDFLNTLSIEQLLINFSDLLNNGLIAFKCTGLKESIWSQTICFIGDDFDALNMHENTSIDRDSILNKIKTNSSFTFAQPILLIPEDFFLIKKSICISPLQKLISRLLSYLLITTLYDVTNLKGNVVDYKLNGYKSISGSFEIDKDFVSCNNYYDIYTWVYNGGNLSDKIGLARNIISLHLSEGKLLEISDSTYSSIISSHKVYERQNIKQYIELRNKISDQIYSFNEKANKIIETFASGFQKSALAFVSLFSTIVITSVLKNRDFTNIFTFDASIISLLFLTGSLIYFFVSLWEVNAQLKRFKKSYLNMKKRNGDLLTGADIDKILNDDLEHIDDKDFIVTKRKYYSILWLSFLLLFLIATLILHWEYTKFNPTENSIFKM